MGCGYWRVAADIDSGRWPLADVDLPRGDVLDLMDASHRLMAGGHVNVWEPSRLQIARPRFADMQPEIRGLRLCSARFRQVLETCRAPADDLQWLEATVTAAGGETREYAVLHFPTTPDLLDRERSTFGPAGVIRQVLRLDLLESRRVIPPPEHPAQDFIVHDDVRRALERKGAVEGVLFRPVLVSQ